MIKGVVWKRTPLTKNLRLFVLQFPAHETLGQIEAPFFNNSKRWLLIGSILITKC